MLFGGIDDERIVLNESSVWSGSRQDADRPDAYRALPEIRRLLVEGKNVEAEALVNANFTCKGRGSGGGQYGCYQVLGSLHLIFHAGDTNATVTKYRRELNLNDAITRMRFTRGGIGFQREMFVSAPDEVMVLRLSADRPGQISFTANLDRPERFATVPEGSPDMRMTGTSRSCFRTARRRSTPLMLGMVTSLRMTSKRCSPSKRKATSPSSAGTITGSKMSRLRRTANNRARRCDAQGFEPRDAQIFRRIATGAYY